MKVVLLSALRTGRLYPPTEIPGIHFRQRLSRLQGKNPNGAIGNQTRDLPLRDAMLQSTAAPHIQPVG